MSIGVNPTPLQPSTRHRIPAFPRGWARRCHVAGVKAVVYERYGSPDVLHLTDVAVPEPGTGQVRLKVAATSVNLSDWECLRRSPAYARIGGLRAPGSPVGRSACWP
jgi:hypothetical protein